MYWENLEPRKTLWAVAEVAWKDSTGVPHRLPAILEDTSTSGACLRVKAPITVGSSLTVKWHREQFSGIARNLRRHGTEFFLGIQRETGSIHSQPSAAPVSSKPLQSEKPLQRQKLLPPDHSSSDLAKECVPAIPPTPSLITALSLLSHTHPENVAVPGVNLLPAPSVVPKTNSQSSSLPAAQPSTSAADAAIPGDSAPVHNGQGAISSSTPAPVQNHDPSAANSPLRSERKVMQPKSFLSKIWPKHDPTGPSVHLSSTEVPVNKSDLESTPSAPVSATDLLPCEDIYRASGIVSPHSDYGVAKIVDMLTSKHIRDLSRDVQRASVLMALDAAGTTVDQILQDAARRQHALDSYGSAQQKEFDDFEARKTKENAAIQIELERLTTHYNDRVKNNLDQVAREKDALGHWQMMKEQECQRIAEAVALCGKQPVAEPARDMPALSKAEAPPEVGPLPKAEAPKVEGASAAK